MNIFQAKFHKLLTLQNATNTKISGENWREMASRHVNIDFAMAAIDELHEFTVSAFVWKWWGKSPELDAKNALMELVDILHFAISEDLVRSGAGPDDSPVSNRMAVAYQESLTGYKLYQDLNTEEGSVGQIAFKTQLLKTAVKRMYICFANEKEVIDWHSFWFSLLLIGGNFDTINKVYLGKACLNKFRQDHGYKLGTYKKSWLVASVGLDSETVNKPKEDNQVLMEWLEIQTEYNEDSINTFLEITYHQLLN